MELSSACDSEPHVTVSPTLFRAVPEATGRFPPAKLLRRIEGPSLAFTLRVLSLCGPLVGMPRTKLL